MSSHTSELLALMGTTSYYVRSASDYTVGTSSISVSKPMENAENVVLISSKLGRNGFNRLKTFRSYEPGWDFGKGGAMSEYAYATLCAFLKSAHLPADKKPSIFLTSEGNLELAWETAAGANVQAEFGPKKIEYFHGERNEEGEAPVSETNRVAALLS